MNKKEQRVLTAYDIARDVRSRCDRIIKRFGTGEREKGLRVTLSSTLGSKPVPELNSAKKKKEQEDRGPRDQRGVQLGLLRDITR